MGKGIAPNFNHFTGKKRLVKTVTKKKKIKAKRVHRNKYEKRSESNGK